MKRVSSVILALTVLILALVLGLSQQARTQPAMLIAIADTYLRSGSPNKNQGQETFLRIQQSGNNRALVRFDQTEIASYVGDGSLVSATLEMSIEHNSNNWGPDGRTVDAHRLTTDWTELGATWNCADDANIGNAKPDCNPQWNGGAFASDPTATVLHAKGLEGWVQFDVTNDVAAFLSGAPNNGWIIKKTQEGKSGRVEYTSREGTAGQGPQLVLMFEVSDECTPGDTEPCFDFVKQADGAFVNVADQDFAGAVLAAGAQGTHTLRFKDGTTWRFASGWRPINRSGAIPGLGLLIEQTDRNGNRLTLERDVNGFITRLVEPAGRALVFTHTNGRLTEIRDPIGRTVRYAYNTSRRLETVTNPAGGVTRYAYDAAGRILTITDSRGITYLTNEYDASGRVVRQTQADGGVWTFEYLRSCKQNEIAKTLVSLCDLLSVQEGAPAATIVTNPRGHKTTYRFSPTGLTTETVDALGQITRFERDAKGQLIAITDSLGRVTRFEYDQQGNVARITDPAGNVRRFEYDPVFNRLTKLTDPLGNTTTLTYDARGNLIRTVDPLGHATQIVYDASGQPISLSDPLGNVTSLSYDQLGHLTTITDPLGNAAERMHDSASRLVVRTDPRGNTTRLVYDALNRVSQITDALNGVTSFSYDENGNVLTVTDALNHTTSYQHDNMDRVRQRTDPVGAIESFAYDPMGNLVRHTDREGQTSTFSYDLLDRRVGSVYADSVTQFVYDAEGRLVQASDSAGGDIFSSYDILDRLSEETTALGTVSYAYDAIGRRTLMNVPGQAATSYSYDANFRLTQITQGSQLADFDYDALGRRTRLTLPNGVATDYSHDIASRVTELVYRNATGVLGNVTYEYDPAGNRTRVGGSFARTLLPEPIATASYDAANRQLQFGDKQMTFDANGNLASIVDQNHVAFLTWDARNRLVEVTRPGVAASFTYDVFGRRIVKRVNGELVQYLYDGVDISQERINGIFVVHVQGSVTGELLSRQGTEHFLSDVLGSSLALTDPLGASQTSYTYDPFGGVSATSSVPNSFQYTGKENDGTGFYYYRARYYSSTLHRFISEDPIGLADGMNLYSYVSNNPINFVDLFGYTKSQAAWWNTFWSEFLKGAHETAIGELEGLAESAAGAISFGTWNPDFNFSGLYAYGDCLKCSQSYWEGSATGRFAGDAVTSQFPFSQNLAKFGYYSASGRAFAYASRLRVPNRSSIYRRLRDEALRRKGLLYNVGLFEGFKTVTDLFSRFKYDR